jgi:hypothetical protein
VVVEHPEDRLEGGHQLLAGGEVLQGERRVGVGAEAAGDEDPEATLDTAVLEGPGGADHADVVEHRLAAVGGTPGEVDLELAGQALRQRIAHEVPVGRLGPRRDVEHLVRAGTRQVAALDVADGVAARLTRREPHGAEQPHQLGHALEAHEVELHVLAGGDVAPAPRVPVRDVGHEIELVGQEPTPGDLHPHHLVVPALALTVDAVVEPEDAEGILLDVTGEVLAEDRLELVGVGELGWIDLSVAHGCSDLGWRRRPASCPIPEEYE